MNGRSARPRLLFAAQIVITALTALDQTIVATALPAIVADLGGEQHLAWAFTAYTLAMTMAMPVFGRAGDLHGRRVLYLGCIAGFVLASVLCGFATSFVALAALRFVQGIGGGGILVLGQAVVADAVPARARARFLAPIGAVFAVASVVAPLLGGVLTDTVGWRWIFWVNAPLGAFALVLAFRSVARVVPQRTGERFDAAGAVLLALWATGVVLVATWGGSAYPWSSPVILATAGFTLSAFGLFVLRCRRFPHPIVPIAVFRDRTVVISSALAFVIGAGVFGLVGYLPGVMQAVFGLSATPAGTLLLPLVLGLMTTSLLTGHWMALSGRYRRLPLLGCAVTACGVLGLATMGARTPILLVAVWIAVIGLGVGCFMQVTTVAVQDAVPAGIVGTATSTVALVRELGVSVGAAALGGLLSARLLQGLGDQRYLAGMSPTQLRTLSPAMRQSYAETYLAALTPLLLGVALLFVLALAVSLFLPDRRLGDEAQASEREADTDTDQITAHDGPRHG